MPKVIFPAVLSSCPVLINSGFYAVYQNESDSALVAHIYCFRKSIVYIIRGM